MFDKFNPVTLSEDENRFVLENLGLPPVVVMNKPLPVGASPKAIRTVIQGVYDLIELEKHEGLRWRGVDAIKKAINTYLEQQERWRVAKARFGNRVPRFPSMATQDGKGRYQLGAPGSDAGVVQTYIDGNGQRRRFEVDLLEYEDGSEEFAPVVQAPKALVEDEDKHRFECPICNHAESFRAGVDSSKNAARARMASHLKRAEMEKELHMELYTNVFRS